MAASQRQRGIESLESRVLRHHRVHVHHPQHPWGTLRHTMLPALCRLRGRCYPHPWEGTGQRCPNREQQGWHSLGTELLCPASRWRIWGRIHPFWGREEDVFHACCPSYCKKTPRCALENADWGDAAERKPAQTFHGSWDLRLPSEGDVSGPQHRSEQLGGMAGAEKPWAFKISLSNKKKWKTPLCQPCIALQLCESYGCARGMDFSSWGEKKSAPPPPLEKSRNGSRKPIFFFFNFFFSATHPMTVFVA